jgi:hypothetical protein
MKTDYIPVDEEQIPPGELAVYRGARVEATDGKAGMLGEFLVNPLTGHISHLILMEGHLWGKKRGDDTDIGHRSHRGGHRFPQARQEGR